ncbi:MAG TPA: hypothetical protein ENI97_11080 [Gammaproteobacteria bacterium]|nr:hypothetical protein [Gammaproteobacteria bacterium]
MTSRSFILFLFISLLLGGCASQPSAPAGAPRRPVSVGEPAYKGNLKARLQTHLKAWRGTPYVYGGLSKRGIDCSGFVYVTYRDVFGQRVARSTVSLAAMGHDVPQNKLRTGDLVFFKTGRRQRHVGVYVGGGRFIHASTSKGVMVSQLNSPYWRSHYWKSVRP